MLTKFLAFLLLSVHRPSWAFQPATGPTRHDNRIIARDDDDSLTSLSSASNHHQQQQAASRREFFQTVVSTTVAVGGMLALGPQSSSMANAAGESSSTSSKVLVLGGTGFVGSRVVNKLQSMGIQVIATSRDGRDGTVPFDVTAQGLDVTKTVQDLAKGCTAVISTIGAIGTEQDLKVNSATGLAALGAKAAGVSEFVYISVAPEVKEFAKDIDFLKPYMTGKTFSQDAVTSNFATGATLIEPTFIHGGDSFNLNPPRVAGFYGEFIEAILSSGPLRAITNIAPEGIIKIALEPPVSVDSVAEAAVAGALGKATAVLDTYDKIVAAAKLV